MHNPSNRGNGVTQASRRPTGKRAGSIAVVILLGLYAFFQPHLNERFGWNLPGLQDRGNGGQVVETSVDTVGTDKASPTDNAVPPVVARDTQAANRTTESKAASQHVDAARPDHRTSDQGPVSQSHDHADSGSSQSASSAKQSNAVQADELRFGLLREIRDGEFLSPQGLQYVSGSAEGHRLEHLRRHTVDAPSRPGKHGVFDGGMEGALATIDQAYEVHATKDMGSKGK